MDFNQVINIFSQRSLLAMDIALKHIRKHHKLYKAILLLLAFGDTMSILNLIYQIGNEISIITIGKCVSQASTVELLKINKIICKEVINILNQLCLNILDMIIVVVRPVLSVMKNINVCIL